MPGMHRSSVRGSHRELRGTGERAAVEPRAGLCGLGRGAADSCWKLQEEKMYKYGRESLNPGHKLQREKLATVFPPPISGKQNKWCTALRSPRGIMGRKLLLRDTLNVWQPQTQAKVKGQGEGPRAPWPLKPSPSSARLDFFSIPKPTRFPFFNKKH